MSTEMYLTVYVIKKLLAIFLLFNFFPECMGNCTWGRGFFIKTEEFLPRVPRVSTRGRGLKKRNSSPSVWSAALGEEDFFKKRKFFPECRTEGTQGRGFLKKQISSPSVALGEEV
jgi:hypothetical protein